jgi:hypothetical protein
MRELDNFWDLEKEERVMKKEERHEKFDFQCYRRKRET